MVADIFNYGTSFLNPAFKWLAPILFLVAFILFYVGNKKYGGELKTAINWLLVSAGCGVAAFLFRVLADIGLLNFKWGESLFFLLFAVMNLLVAWKFLKIIEGVKA
ncbi:hypothetical protein C0585_07045 [Candidatus Woesearchaeota archaeon]|nr:MAG: hypothetical protein C0585_07045 [Candidatus Woesearchaeota archaeon]